MRTRSFVALAASLALVLEGFFAAPAFATTTTITSSTQPIVAWSESTTGSITLVPNYTANAVTNPSGFATVVGAGGSAAYSGYGTGSGNGESCTASVSQSGNFINFGVVYAPIGTNRTVCDYQNAMLAIVTTNDTNGWTLTQQLQIAPSTDFILCAAFPQVQVVKTLPLVTSSYTYSSAAINETGCTGTGQETLGSGDLTPGLNTLIPNPNATGTTTGTFYQGEDALLIISGTPATTTYTVTMNVTLTLN
jgi:hypothetical protein